MKSTMVSVVVTASTRISNQETFLCIGNQGEHHLYLHVDSWVTAEKLGGKLLLLSIDMKEAASAPKD